MPFFKNSSEKPRLWKYQIEKEDFAAGCFGKISLARDPNNREVIIKRLPKDKVSSIEVAKEVEAGKILTHPNIARFHEHFSNNEWDFLVFERIHGSDLFSLIEKKSFVAFEESHGRKIFKQILKAIRYAHSKNVVHRDIKLENILMDTDGNVTVIDFGLCDLVKKGQSSERFCGSMDYVAPEVLTSKVYNGFQADCFSLGVVLYTLLFAEFPFVANDRVKILKSNLPHPKVIWNERKLARYQTTELARDLIMKMLNPDPTQRINIDQVKDHPWIKKRTNLSSSGREKKVSNDCAPSSTK